MKPIALVGVVLSLIGIANARAVGLDKLKLLYVGEPTNSTRAKQVISFLQKNASQIQAMERRGFKPEQADGFNVVLLDWPQSGNVEQERNRPSPLGARSGWTKPTVLLGSAGLNLAIVWKVRGGSGCTCLTPFAYGLRDHSVFREPFLIETNAMVARTTPPAFRTAVTNVSVQMLPLVRDQKREWKAGWCTYPDGFENNPDVEYFCGGENEKTAAAAACWRQGNLLHFGFEQSPEEMNEAGQKLLLNCIAYISQFTEDRPIAVTPSVFAGPRALPRTYLDRRLRDKGETNELDWIASQSILDALKGKDSSEIRRWHAENRGYLHPSWDAKLEVDKEARALGAAIDTLEFFDKAIADLRTGGPEARRAFRLLADYAPDAAPKKPSVTEWESWLAENRSYLFFSDQGDYAWYVDPLAKKRGVPTSQLRGPARASPGASRGSIAVGAK